MFSPLFTSLKLMAFYPLSSPWHPSAPRPQNSQKHPKDFAIFFKLGLLLVKLMSTATLLDGHSGHSPLVLFGLKLRKLMAGMFCQPLKQYVCGKRR